MRIPQFGGTFTVAGPQQGKAHRIIQQVIAEGGSLDTQSNGGSTSFTVPDRFDKLIKHIFDVEGIPYTTDSKNQPGPGVPLRFAGNDRCEDDKAIIRIDYDPKTAPPADGFVPFFTFQLMMRNPKADAVLGNLKPGEDGKDVLELHVNRNVLPDAVKLLKEMGAPVLETDPPVEETTGKTVSPKRQPWYKKAINWLLGR